MNPTDWSRMTPQHTLAAGLAWAAIVITSVTLTLAGGMLQAAKWLGR
jgi:hypothetical protein